MYMIEFHPLPSWIGWVGFVLAIGFFGWLLRKMKKDQENPAPSKYQRIPIYGFATVFIPIGFPEDSAENIAGLLATIKDMVWDKCQEIYKITPEHPWPVHEILLTKVPEKMPAAHPHVYWNIQVGKIHLLFDKQTSHWFAREVHNVFRYLNFGIAHIYEPVDGVDQDNAQAVNEWIVTRFKL